MVHEPTRQQYLLDLLLTDVPGTKVRVGSHIADHKFLLAQVPMREVKSLLISKRSFRLARANWKDLEAAFADVDWAPLERGCAEDALNYFMDVLWTLLCTYIPFEVTSVKKKSHPWINERCEAAVRRKNEAEGTASFEEVRQQCSQILAAEHQEYVSRLREKIAARKKGSKEGWRLNRE